MPLYIDKKVEDFENDLEILVITKNSLQSKLDFEKDLKERENLQAKINLLSKQIIEIKETIAKYYPNNLGGFVLSGVMP
jgi:hypothetical protein